MIIASCKQFHSRLQITVQSFVSVFQIGHSNNDPKIIGRYYLQCVQDLCHAPAILRTDYGTENGIAAAIHSYFHQDESAHRYGKSTSNQRIEALWSKFRPSIQGWIDYFRMLSEQNDFSPGNLMHTYAIRWSYQKLLRHTVESFMTYWNTHHIANVGIPDILFHTRSNCGIHPDDAALIDAENYCSQTNSSITGDIDVDGYFQYLMDELQMPLPSNKMEAFTLYQRLLDATK